jgi:hypothetical protein
MTPFSRITVVENLVGMFDHVTIRVSDLDASRRFYELALATLGFDDMYVGESFPEWNDFSISEAGDDKPPTRNLHVAFVAPSREAVDDWWRVMTGATTRRSTSSTASHSPPGTTTTGRPVSGPSITPVTTVRSSSTPAAATSRPSVTTASARRPSA